jgi:hypothetical protein
MKKPYLHEQSRHCKVFSAPLPRLLCNDTVYLLMQLIISYSLNWSFSLLNLGS